MAITKPCAQCKDQIDVVDLVRPVKTSYGSQVFCRPCASTWPLIQFESLQAEQAVEQPVINHHRTPCARCKVRDQDIPTHQFVKFDDTVQYLCLGCWETFRKWFFTNTDKKEE